MWQAIQYVSSGFTLCAFIIAAVVSLLKRKSQDELKRIELAPPETRADLVSRTLEFFAVDTSSLTKQQQFDIAMKQINARVERFRVVAIVVVLLAFLGAALSALSISKLSGSKPSDSKASIDSQPHGNEENHKQVEIPQHGAVNNKVVSGSGEQFGVLRKEEIPVTHSMTDLDAAEALIEKRLNSYPDSELLGEIEVFCKNLSVMALHWQQDIDENELAHPNIQTRPANYADEMRASHKDEYAMRHWPEAQALRVVLVSRLANDKVSIVDQESPRGAELFVSRYLEAPEDVNTIRNYLQALAKQVAR